MRPDRACKRGRSFTTLTLDHHGLPCGPGPGPQGGETRCALAHAARTADVRISREPQLDGALPRLIRTPCRTDRRRQRPESRPRAARDAQNPSVPGFQAEVAAKHRSATRAKIAERLERKLSSAITEDLAAAEEGSSGGRPAAPRVPGMSSVQAET